MKTGFHRRIYWLFCIYYHKLVKIPTYTYSDLYYSDYSNFTTKGNKIQN